MNTCNHCHKEIIDQEKAIYLPRRKIYYCSKYCKYIGQAATAEISCKVCGKKRLKPISQIKKHPESFCSTSCATTWTNREFPKRFKTGKCKECGDTINNSRVYCFNCWSQKDQSKKGALFEKTLADVRALGLKRFHSAMRQVARQIFSSKNNLSEVCCTNCGYSKHTEICHIRAIKDFPNTTTVREVTDYNNLIALCPNCHWELDNGILKI